MKKLVAAMAMMFAVGAFAQTYTPGTAFSSGMTTGKETAGKLSPGGAPGTGEVTNVTASKTITGFTESGAATSYWTGNSTSLDTLNSAGSTQKSVCADPAVVLTDPKLVQFCKAVNALQRTGDKLSSGTLPANTKVLQADPLIVQGTAIADDPMAVAGAMTGNYSACKTETRTIDQSPIQEQCQEYRVEVEEKCQPVNEPQFTIANAFACIEQLGTVNSASCAVTSNVTVGTTYNYACQTKRFTEASSTCSNKLTVTCDPVQNNCDPATVMSYGAAPPGMTFGSSLDLATGDFLLVLQSAGALAEGTHDKTWSFNVSDLPRVNKFFLDLLTFEDWIWVQINGTTIHLGPYGMGFKIEALPGPSGLEVFCDATATPCGPLELNTSWVRNPNIDLVPFLLPGANSITIRTIVGGTGSTLLRIRGRAQCPAVCTDTWDNTCASFQARAL